MNLNSDLTHQLYTQLLRPLLFKFDPETIHDFMTNTGVLLGSNKITQTLTSAFFNYENPALRKTVLGIEFKNPVGLAAGFDYNGQMLKILQQVGFGFVTVGTVTNKPYEGNSRPRFTRLIKSKSVLVNKGFRSEGADKVADRLNDPALKDVTFGVSIGSTNIPEIDTKNKAITDYLEGFVKMRKVPYIKYFELNISCPNTMLSDGFADIEAFTDLVQQVHGLNLKRPIFVKMPNEISNEHAQQLVEIGLKNGFSGYIFSNLAKNRQNSALHTADIEKIKPLKGNLSGLPTRENSNRLISHIHNRFGDNVKIIGCGGIFNETDAKQKLDLGAELVQLVTGMIFEGPGLIAKINRNLAVNRVK